MSRFHYWLWALAESRDFHDRRPRRFWRWLLKVEDRRHGWFHPDEDYDE